MQEGIGEREVMIAIEILGNLDHDGYLAEDNDVILAGLHSSGLDADEHEMEKFCARSTISILPVLPYGI